jgi:hypothetical protein
MWLIYACRYLVISGEVFSGLCVMSEFRCGLTVGVRFEPETVSADLLLRRLSGEREGPAEWVTLDPLVR